MKRVPVLIPFLCLISVIFIGILVFAYLETRKANPQMLDEQGRPVRGASLYGLPSCGAAPAPQAQKSA